MRRYRSVIILLLLFAVPIGGAILVALFILPRAPAKPVQAEATQSQAPVKKEKTRKILAAARELPIGTLLRHEDMIGIDVGEGEVARAHVLVKDAKTIDSFRGHAVRETIAAGAPFTRFAVVAPGQRGFLAAVLAPGTRAATIRLGAGTSHAGLIDPGDRVDVILTAKMGLGGRTERVFARTILEDVRVVAVDRQVDLGAQPAADGKDIKRAKIVTATLEVSPAKAGPLALGEQEGTLSLVVRPLAAAAARRGPAEAVDLRELLDLPEPEAPAEAVEPAPVVKPPPETVDAERAPLKTVRIIRGGEVSEEAFGDEAGVIRDGNRSAVMPIEEPPAQGRN